MTFLRDALELQESFRGCMDALLHDDILVVAAARSLERREHHMHQLMNEGELHIVRPHLVRIRLARIQQKN